MNQHYLQLYADFIVKVGVNVRPRQNFICLLYTSPSPRD